MGNVPAGLQSIFRPLRKSPAASLLITACLAIGIGANVAVFNLLKEVVGALPHPHAERLVAIREVKRLQGNSIAVNTGNFLDWRVRNRVFDSLAHFGVTARIWQSATHAEMIISAMVAPELIDMLGGSPVLGRGFDPSEGGPGKRDAALLDYGFWQSRFGGSRRVLGKKIRVDEKIRTIVGVLPSGFRLPLRYTSKQPVLYTPYQVTPPKQGRGGRHLQVVARLRPGVSLQQARREMRSIAANLEQEHPRANQGKSVRVVPLHKEVVGDMDVALSLIFGASSLVLLVVCVNVGCLLMARSLARRQELAVRFALGAGRLRLILEGMRESIALGLTGGLAGLLVAAGATRWLKHALAGEIPRLGGVTLDISTLAFTFAVSLLVCVACGIVPVLVAVRQAGANVLRAGGQRSTAIRQRSRFLLLASQSALLIVLLVASTAAVRTYWRMTRVDLGFKPGNVLVTLSLLPRTKYREQTRSLAFYESLSEQLVSLPGIEAAAPAWGLPHEKGYAEAVRVRREGEWQQEYAVVRRAGIGYFRIFDISLLEGRLFGVQDRMGSPQAAIINQAMARSLSRPGGAIGAEVVIPSLEEA
ncbi:MAG: ABC transporter permease, partial [Acidobacteriota bacterium]